MARPQKKRHVYCMPKYNCFSPSKNSCSTILMTVDEHETIRLMDLEGYTQEECAKQMNVSRTTIQGIYISARKKIADAIVNGKKLIISGGDYKFCEGSDHGCKRQKEKHCCNHSINCKKKFIDKTDK